MWSGRVRTVAAPALVLVWLVFFGYLHRFGHGTVDEQVYRHGGQLVYSGGDLYGFRIDGYGFTYPPFSALTFGPLALLPEWGAFTLVSALSVCALLVLVRASLPAGLSWIRRADVRTGLVAAVLMAMGPVRSTFDNGQIGLALIALVAYDVLVWRRGIFVGLATAVKLTPGIFVVYLLAVRRYREAAWASGTFLVATALGWLVAPSASRQFWTHGVFGGSGLGDVARTTNQSIRGVADRLVGATDAPLLWAVVAVPVGICGLYLAIRAFQDGREVLAVGVTGVTGCLVSPVSWTHHWAWCIPLLVGMWPVARRLGSLATAGVVAMGLVFVFSDRPAAWFGEAGVVGDAWSWGFTGVALLAGLVALACPRPGLPRVRDFLHSDSESAKPEVGTRLG